MKNVQFHWRSRSPTFVFNICQMLQCNSNIIYNILTNIYSLDVFRLSSDVKKKEEKEEEVIEGGFPTVAQTWQFLSYPTSFSPIQGLCAHGKAITDTHAHRLPHTASLIHTYGGHTFSHSSRKWLLLISAVIKIVPLKINIQSAKKCIGEQDVILLFYSRSAVNL